MASMLTSGPLQQDGDIQLRKDNDANRRFLSFSEEK